MRAEREHGLPRLVALAIEGVGRAPDPARLLAYARSAILRSDMTTGQVGEFVEPFLRHLPHGPRGGGSAALPFAEWLVLDGRLDASVLGTLGVDYAVSHDVLALPRCLRGCHAATVRSLAASPSRWVRWAVVDFVADALLDIRRPCALELDLVDRWLGDPFEPVARQARYVKEDRRINELVWRLRDRPRHDREYAEAREAMRGHRRHPPTTFDAFALAFQSSVGPSTPYTDDDSEAFLGRMAQPERRSAR